MVPDSPASGQIHYQMSEAATARFRDVHVPNAVDKMKPGPFINFQRDEHGLPTITVLDSANGPIKTMAKNPDGTISQTTKIIPNSTLFMNYHKALQHRQLSFSTEAASQYAEAEGPRATASLARTMPKHHEQLAEITENCHTPSGTRRINPGNFNRYLNHLVSTYLTEPATLKAAAKTAGNRSLLTPTSYNAVHRQMSAVTGLQEQHPATARMYLLHLAKDTDNFSSNAKLMAAITRRMKLTKQDHPLIHATAEALKTATGRSSPTTARAIITVMMAMGLNHTDTPTLNLLARNWQMVHALSDSQQSLNQWALQAKEGLQKALEASPRQRRTIIESLHKLAEENLSEHEKRLRLSLKAAYLALRAPSKRSHQMERLTEQTADQLIKELKHWTIWERPSPSQVTFMTPPDKPPYWEMTRMPDGTMQARSAGLPDSAAKLYPQGVDGEHALRWATGELIQRISSRFKTARELLEFTHPNLPQWSSVRPKLGKEATRVADAVYSKPRQTVKGQPNEPIKERFRYLQAAQRAAEELVDSAVAQQANSLMPNIFQDDVAAYNWTVINQDTITKLEQSAPGLVQYYLHKRPGYQPPQGPTSPSEIVRAAREHTGYSGNVWKAFLRLGPRNFMEHTSENQQREKDLIVRTLAEANRPQANDPERLNVLLAYGTTCVTYADDTHWEHGNAWQAWINLVNQFLNTGRHTGGRNANNEFAYVANTLMNHVQTNLPWTPANWHTLHNRATRWHYHREDQQYILTDHQKDLEWDSALHAFELNDITITPVTSAKTVQGLARRMRNCLMTFINPCENGKSRIFTLSTADQLHAAAEIKLSGGTWLLSQLEAPLRTPVPQHVRNAAAQIPHHYQQALKNPGIRQPPPA